MPTFSRDEWSISPAVQHVPAANGYAALDNIDVLYDLTSDVNNLYVGYAQQGAAGSDALWTIRRIGLTSGSPTSSQWTAKGVAVWNNRATETYL